jgi:23S rRNA pseudouridine1911/1915/1917 synthase
MPNLNSGYEYRSTTGADDAGLTVVDYLAARFPHSTREAWRRRVAAGLVMVGGRRAEPSSTLGRSETVVWLRPPWEEPDAPCSFALLYRDPHLLIVAKPRGLPVLPGGGYLQHTLLSLVRSRFPNANPLHRLGRGASGLVLFSRNPEAARRLSEEWCREGISKIYRALVVGSPPEDFFRVEIPIGRVSHRLLGTVHAACRKGKPARSDVRVLERRSGETLVEVRIFTGRTHQVRIHMAAVGHPLSGDPFYARGGVPVESPQALPGDTGFHLHAGTLEFTHPFSGGCIKVDCPAPPILREGYCISP